MIRFEELYWHDTTILEIRVYKRANENDCVELTLDYINEYEPVIRVSRRSATFTDCYLIRLALNRGTADHDVVFDGVVIDPSEEVLRARRIWESVGGRVPPTLAHYRIQTGKTGGSVYDIVAGGFEFA